MIKKCNYNLKCDVDGCRRKANKDISFNGETVQLRLCDECLKKLYDELAEIYCKEKNRGKKEG